MTLPAAPLPVIRPARPADIPALGQLGALLVGEHYAYDTERFIAATPETAAGYANFLRSQLSKPRVVVLVAELDHEIVGYTYAAVEGMDYMALRGPAGVVYDLLVAPAHRQRGLGQQLLTATLRALTALGAPQLVLSTAARNEAAQRLFERAGFRRTMVEMTRDAAEPPLPDAPHSVASARVIDKD